MTFVDEMNRFTAKCSRNVIGQEDDALEEESEWLILTPATVKEVQKILKEVGSRTETGVDKVPTMFYLQILC